MKSVMKITTVHCLGKVIDLLSEKALKKYACDELIKVFGRKYLQDNYENTLQAHGMADDETYMFFVGIKDDEDLPDREANEKGWVVYGKVLVNAITGKIVNTEYVLE